MTALHKPSTLRSRRSVSGACLLAAFFFLGLTARGLAENPWTSSSLGWASSARSSQGWSSWETTHGGTFGDSFGSHQATRSATPPPRAIHNPEIDPAMIKAASIAEQRALPQSASLCWRYVKEALVAAGSVNSYPQTAYAKDAGLDLVRNHGFVQLFVRNAACAPVGSVLVY